MQQESISFQLSAAIMLLDPAQRAAPGPFVFLFNGNKHLPLLRTIDGYFVFMQLSIGTSLLEISGLDYETLQVQISIPEIPNEQNAIFTYQLTPLLGQ